MVERTFYFPANKIGRYVLNRVIERVGCSIGDIYRVADSLAVPITVVRKDIPKLEKILQMYDLM